MTKIMISFTALCAGFMMASCGTVKNGVTLVPMDGEWNIVKVDGKMLNIENGLAPMIGFDEVNNRIYGNSGCNRMMGSYQADLSKPGSLSFGQMGTTRMACPDMTVENNILAALNKVRSYKALTGKEKVALCDERGKELLVIQKTPLDRSALNGEWKIVQIKGNTIGKSEVVPFIGFDVNESRIYGNAGCNSINGSLGGNDADPYSLDFGQVVSTMMACPDMSTEDAVLKALNQVKSFKFIGKSEVELLNGNGSLLMKLIKR